MPIILSFDVEEHDRIEAAAGLTCPPDLRARYAGRMDETTRWLVDRLDAADIRATFFIVGQIAHSHLDLIRLIRRSGHEVASHGWDHQRLHRFTPAEFRADVRRSKDALEQASGAAVVGYRAPTFSVVRQTAWAIDVLAEEGFRYDSSVFPVRHDRYGVPGAPRQPFRVRGQRYDLLEFPPATLRWLGFNLPAGGGGYFRVFPLAVLERALRQLRADGQGVATLYFHPWEFDADQPRLPLGLLKRWRTYAGTRRSRPRLLTLLQRHRFVRAVDVLAALDGATALPRFGLAA